MISSVQLFILVFSSDWCFALGAAGSMGADTVLLGVGEFPELEQPETSSALTDSAMAKRMGVVLNELISVLGYFTNLGGRAKRAMTPIIDTILIEKRYVISLPGNICRGTNTANPGNAGRMRLQKTISNTY